MRHARLTLTYTRKWLERQRRRAKRGRFRRGSRNIGGPTDLVRHLDLYVNPSPVRRVYNAWNVSGPNSSYHEKMKSAVRRDWPVLGIALDGLPDPERSATIEQHDSFK